MSLQSYYNDQYDSDSETPAENEVNATLEFWAQQDAEEAAEAEKRAMWDLSASESDEEAQVAQTSTDVHMGTDDELEERRFDREGKRKLGSQGEAPGTRKTRRLDQDNISVGSGGRMVLSDEFGGDEMSAAEEPFEIGGVEADVEIHGGQYESRKWPKADQSQARNTFSVSAEISSC